MKKKSDKIKIKISNKVLYTLVVVGILVIAGVGVWAYGTSNASNFGHSLGELETCAEGESLQVVDGEWDCVSGGSSSGMTKISAYKSSSQTIYGGDKVLTFGTELYDTNNEFSNSRFTAKQSGYYFIHAHALVSQLGEENNWLMWIDHNSGFIAEMRYISPGADALYSPTLDVQRVYYLDEGDWIQIRIFHSQSNERSVYSGKENTYLDIYRIV